MKKQLIKNIIAVLLSILVAATSIWLPGYLIGQKNQSKIGLVQEVPSEYYSGPSEAMIRNASAQLTNDQCLQLILGTWDSTVSETDKENCNVTEFGMKTITINRVEDLYTKGLYPMSLSSYQDTWYSWTATPYRAIDSTFKTYAAYFWDITFTKFDNSVSHRFIVTESGDILYAEMNIHPEYTDIAESSQIDQNIFPAFRPNMSKCSYLMYYYGEYITTTFNTNETRVTQHDDSTTTYKTATLSDAETKKLNTLKASSFISDFEGFSPDEAYLLTEKTGLGKNSEYNFVVSYKKTENNFQILLQPE